MYTLLLLSLAEATYQRLSTQLDPQTIRVIWAADERALERALVRGRLTVILVDLELPGWRGWHWSTQLHTDRRSRRTPQIALTGRPQAEECSAAFAAGFMAYLQQPVAIPTLLLHLDQACAPTHARRQPHSGIGAAEAEPAPSATRRTA